MNLQFLPAVFLAFGIIGEPGRLISAQNSTAATPTRPDYTTASVTETTPTWPSAEVDVDGSTDDGDFSGSGFGIGAGRIACPANLTLEWNDQLARAPYAVLTTNPRTGEVTCNQGLMLELIKEIIAICCSVEPNYVHAVSEGPFGDDSEDVVQLPITINFRDSDMGLSKVPLLPNTGVVFLVPTLKKSYAMKMLMSIANTWPVLVLTLALSLLAGIVAWSLDTRTNPDHFPTRFLLGTWEGFWWAFVSMTTVGYGDRSPKSVLGRLFAVMWILIGICICSIFTATLTTSLTTISLYTRISLSGSKVAAMVNSIEAVTAFNYQADVVRVLSIQEIRRKLDSGEVVGALLDSYTIASNRNLFPKEKFDIQNVIPQDFLEYGALINHNKLAKCVRDYRYTEESTVFELLEFYNNGSLKSGLGEASEESKGIFDPDGLLFRPTLLGCLGIVGILSVLGLLWEGYRYLADRRAARRHLARDNSLPSRGLLSFKRNHVPPVSYQPQVTSDMLDGLERRLVDEIHAELHKLREIIEGRQKNNQIPAKNGVPVGTTHV